MIDLDKLSALEKNEPKEWRVSYITTFDKRVAAIPFVNVPFDLFINVEHDGNFFGKEFPVSRAEFLAEMRNQLPELIAYVVKLEMMYIEARSEWLGFVTNHSENECKDIAIDELEKIKHDI